MKQKTTKREEYKKLCFVYGTQHVERLFAGFSGYKTTRSEHSYKIVLETTETYFKGL